MSPLFYATVSNHITYSEGVTLGDLIASSTKYTKRNYFLGFCYRERTLDERIDIEPGTNNPNKIGFTNKSK